MEEDLLTFRRSEIAGLRLRIVGPNRRPPRPRIERITDVIYVCQTQACAPQAEAQRFPGQIMGVVDGRMLAVFDSIEALFLRGRDYNTIYEESC